MSEEQRPVPRWPALLGLLLVLPGVVFVAADLLKYEVGMEFIYVGLGPVVAPRTRALEVLQVVVVVGGSLTALVLSTLQIARFRFRHEAATVTGTLSVRLSWPHLVVTALALVVLDSLTLYIVAENL